MLLLGTIAPPPRTEVPRPLPGIERLHVSSPTPLVDLNIPVISASGALLIDADSGQELFSLAPDERRPMASLTKIMTALLIVEHHQPHETVVVPGVVESIGGSAIGLIPGDRFTVGALLRALLIPSANDAAYALAMFHAKNVSSFVAQMNNRAAALGLRNTHFANPAGLDHPEQYSTPRDLAWLTLAALRRPAVASIVKMPSAHIVSSDGKEYSMRNTNEMLHDNSDVDGVKTGTTTNAGECLIILFREKGRRYLLVLLGSHDRYTDSFLIVQALHKAML